MPTQGSYRSFQALQKEAPKTFWHRQRLLLLRRPSPWQQQRRPQKAQARRRQPLLGGGGMQVSRRSTEKAMYRVGVPCEAAKD